MAAKPDQDGVDHYRSMLVMALHRTFSEQMTFTAEEQVTHGNLRLYDIVEARHPNGDLVVTLTRRPVLPEIPGPPIK